MNQQAAGDPMETVDYVRSMLKQLQEMARTEGDNMLAYLIEMAHIEANDVLRGASRQNSLSTRETAPPEWRSNRPARSSSSRIMKT